MPPILILILLTTLLRLAFAATTGLGMDESYMIAAGRSFALAYFDHPPLSWWLSHGSAVLFGSESPVVVRLPFILLFALSQALVYGIGKRIGGLAGADFAGAGFGAAGQGGTGPGGVGEGGVGEGGAGQGGAGFGAAGPGTAGFGGAAVRIHGARIASLGDGGQRAGLFAAVVLNLSPVFGVTGGTWVLPDGPLIAALLGAAYALLRAIEAPSLRWWLLAGVCAGLALLSKYSAILSIGGAFLFLLVSPAQRRLLLTPYPYLAAVAAAVVFCPVVIWNAGHHWASFAFQGDRALGMAFHPFAPLATLGGEALFILPWFWLPMMILLVRALPASAPWDRRLLAWLGLPPIVLFALVSLWSRQRILFHWAAPGYLMLVPLLGAWLAEHSGKPWVRRGLVATAGLLVTAMLVIATQIQFDWLGGALAPLGRKDPTAEGLDWRSVRDDLTARGVLHDGTLPDGTLAGGTLPDGTLAAAFNWRDAGKFGYALGGTATMLCLSDDAREFAIAQPLSRYQGRDVVLLAVDPAPYALDTARRWFRSVEVLPPSSIRLRGRVLAGVTVLIGHGLRPAPDGAR